MSRQSPTMAEWIGERAIAVAPRLIRERHPDFGAGFDRLIVEGVYVFYIQMDPDRSTTDAFRAKSAHLRDFIIKEEYRIADFDRSVHKCAAVRSWDPAKLFRVEGLLIKLDGLSRPLHAKMGSNCVGAFRDRVNFRRHFYFWVLGCRSENQVWFPMSRRMDPGDLDIGGKKSHAKPQRKDESPRTKISLSRGFLPVRRPSHEKDEVPSTGTSSVIRSRTAIVS